jgi:hypothetical protein
MGAAVENAAARN